MPQSEADETAGHAEPQPEVEETAGHAELQPEVEETAGHAEPQPEVEEMALRAVTPHRLFAFYKPRGLTIEHGSAPTKGANGRRLTLNDWVSQLEAIHGGPAHEGARRLCAVGRLDKETRHDQLPPSPTATTSATTTSATASATATASAMPPLSPHRCHPK